MRKEIENTTISWENMVCSPRPASHMREEELFLYSNMPEHKVVTSLNYHDKISRPREFDGPVTPRENIYLMLQKLEHGFDGNLRVQRIMEEDGDEGEDIFDIRISLEKNIVNLNIYVDRGLRFAENEVYLVYKNNIQIGIIDMIPLMLNNCINA